VRAARHVEPLSLALSLSLCLTHNRAVGLSQFRLNYYRNKEEWQSRMPPKGSVPLGFSHVELLRSISEPVDYRMTIRTNERVFSFRASLKDLKVWISLIRCATLCSVAMWSSDELASFVALCGVTEECINVIVQSRMDGRAPAMCRTVNEMMEKFGITEADTSPASPKFLLAKDVEKIYDLFDRYRMYASTMRIKTGATPHHASVPASRALISHGIPFGSHPPPNHNSAGGL
jgi:hypothetical protein